MKTLTFFVLFIFISTNAQTTDVFSKDPTTRKGISESDLLKAKDMFKQMAYSDDYRKMLNYSKIMAEN